MHTEPISSTQPDHLILYDGVCGLCTRSVQFLLQHDASGRFYFAPLQGETSESLRKRYPQIPKDVDTIVYLERGQVHLRSRAVLNALKHLGYPWHILSWLRVIPARLADLGYRAVAAVRYRVWGKHDVCAVPSLDQRARFLP
ncbi:MAG: DCC1-like thiol-disulfide oxidoreductase family protein [Myxococcota bacterium]